VTTRVRRADAIRWAAALVALAIVMFPFYWMVNTSLKPATEIFLSPPTFASSNWSLDAYATVLTQRPVARYFVNSLAVALGTTVLSVTLAALAAYGFTRFFPHGATPFIVFLLFTKMLPETLLIIPYFQLMSDVGLLNTYLALILAYSSFALPFSVWMLIGFFRSIPRDIDEAAMIDGATYLQAFFRVILPLARPGLVAVPDRVELVPVGAGAYHRFVDVRVVGGHRQHGRGISRPVERIDGGGRHRCVAGDGALLVAGAAPGERDHVGCRQGLATSGGRLWAPTRF
jgi:ABC-type glycerol-3-phosphate transport system permease component